MEKKLPDLYSFFTTFFMCALFGWFFETLTVLILTGKLTGRGLLFICGTLGESLPPLAAIPVIGSMRLIWGLPIIVIYGIGGCLIAVGLKPLERKPAALFLSGAIFMTLFELASSYFCEFFLRRALWDYRDEFLNFDGRICLRASILWGMISLFTVKFLIPKSYRVYITERKLGHTRLVYGLLFAYTLICAVAKYWPLR